MKKKLKTTAILNELKGNSGFFQNKVESKPASQEVFSQSERTEIRSEIRTVALPPKRMTRRYSFEFYDDQIKRVQKMKYEALLKGQTMSMSEVVRQALDFYFQNQDRQKE